jgi:hypothetical protein
MGAKIKQGNRTKSVVNDALTEQPYHNIVEREDNHHVSLMNLSLTISFPGTHP